ncbi:ATP-binding cassette domain-containing protein [Proteiniborus sp. MB09-C3]|uniref:ABC transporter ATP-binding protein n=1 Tax=Proteiniborus sp. MB09-C3 TaxID=3050072 RepID=UPI0025575C6B|nr:ATP-binding cassette domain-containing protein [Proteiniborus sp. MB09-C3]WIV12337.1 ATP-binding cassette domain-containing protein [Proteiniborus sp. MB09-C3]
MLKVRNIMKSYGKLKVLEDISFDLELGESLVLAGKSGSGKTTLSKIIIGLERCDSGDVIHLGKKLNNNYRKRTFSDLARIQYIFQDPYSALEPSFTLEQTLMETVNICRRNKYNPMDIDDALAMVDRGFLEQKKRKISTFSGGQQQKICIARALITYPKLIIADEATSMLDYDNRIEINNLLNKIKSSYELSIISIVHDIDFYNDRWDKIAVINDHKLVDLMDFRDFFEYASSDYSKELINSHKYFYG